VAFAAFLSLVAAALLACGSSRRQLQSITLNPATAHGQAQFTATGFYSDGSTVTPLPAKWFTIMPWYKELNFVQFFDLDDTGKASCNGNAGTFDVVASAPVDPHVPLSQMTPTSAQVSGRAHLTCP